MPDGFPDAESLKHELREIYGDPEPNKPWSPARLNSTHPPFTDRIAALGR